ncbi:putative serine/threonine-protein kinase isoform X1 [Rhododendron vialii]|uniref:putative serine/threonine-protein kinase isoform X1 n=1 Tax=Rhododendron vialii TaxID=182163 RepID=UPI00265E776F|nr:putative serine/threonine-protein kinase isoform X1 [Rhododendron vialii]
MGIQISNPQTKHISNKCMKFSLPCSKFLRCFSPSDTLIPNRSLDGEGGDEDFRVFAYNELKAASQSFHPSNKIGEGGFGSVYKGRLRDGTFVAIKVLAVELESMRGEREFIAELAALSNIKHENLVKLRGCCVHGAERFLVYDHMENNSLSHTFLGRVQTRVKFSWAQRRDVSLGVARGLTYLHEEVKPRIIHRDIKASNILLDQHFTPKVADFGLSKLFGDDASYVSTRVAGTLGYLAPEYAVSGHLSRKSDVYSFGVLLMEIVSGRPVMNFDVRFGEHYLVDQAWEMYRANTLAVLVDPVLNGNFPAEEAVRFLKVGLLCVQEMAKKRPAMSEVLKMLTDETDTSNVEISQPGLIPDLMDVKIRSRRHSELFSKGSTSVSTMSPGSSYT